MAMETELPSLTLQAYWWGRGDVCAVIDYTVAAWR